jgi:hypothetical protein
MEMEKKSVLGQKEDWCSDQALNPKYLFVDD